MSMADLTTAAPAIDRDRYGRPLIIPPDGGKAVPYTRCTTLVGTLEDRFNLGKWEQRAVATGLARRPDLLMAAASTPTDDKKALDRICEDARNAAAASAAATTGTALHAFTEAVDRGEDVPNVPAAHLADIAAYKRATAKLEMLVIERLGVWDMHQVAGTPDRIVGVDGSRYIFDLKTGSVAFGAGKIAMQLAVYAHSLAYDIATGERSEWVDGGVSQEWAIVCHLPAGTGECTLYWADIGAAWHGVGLALKVRQWRKQTGLLRPIDPAHPAHPDGPASIRSDHERASADAVGVAIACATSTDELTRLWREHQAVWTASHTGLAKLRKDELMGAREAAKTVRPGSSR